MNEGTPVTNPDGSPRTLQDVFKDHAADMTALDNALDESTLNEATYPDGEPVGIADGLAFAQAAMLAAPSADPEELAALLDACRRATKAIEAEQRRRAGDTGEPASVDLEDADMELIVMGLHALSNVEPGTDDVLRKLGFTS